jgi:hypothetical protein
VGMSLGALHDLALIAGAKPLGTPAHYLFTAEQLAALVRLVSGDADLIALHDRLEKSGVPVTLYC